jgi:hypothetical protein
MPANAFNNFTDYGKDAVHLSHHETAPVLGPTLRQVKTRLLRARLQLRDALAPGARGKWSRGDSVGYEQKPIEASSGTWAS